MRTYNNNIRGLLLLVLVLLPMLGSAGPVVTITRSDFNLQIDSPDVFIDQTGTLSFQEVSSPDNLSAFSRWDNQQLILSPVGTTWLCINIRNITEQPVNTVLRLRTSEKANSIFFIEQPGQLFTPIKPSRPDSLLTNHRFVPLTVSPGQTTRVFLKLSSDFAPRISLRLASPEHTVSEAQTFVFTNGLVLGLNIMLLCLSVILIRKRRAVFLPIALISLATLLFHMAWVSFPAPLWDYLSLNLNVLQQSMVLMAYGTTMYLARSMLQPLKHNPMLDRLLMPAFFLSLIGSAVILLLSLQLPNRLFQCLLIANTLILTLAGLVRLYEGDSYANRLLALFIPFTVMQIITSLSAVEILPLNASMMESVLLLSAQILIASLIVISLMPPPGHAIIEPATTVNDDDQLPDWSHLGHELRTPMNGILGMTELMHNTSLSNRQLDYLYTIQLSGQELLNLINQVVDIGKLGSGDIAPQEEPFDTDDLLHNCLERYSYKADQIGLELACWADNNIPAQLSGDAARITRIINSLMSHAINHTEQGVILLSISRVHNSATSDGNLRIKVQATDNGAGFNEARQAFANSSQSDKSLCSSLSFASRIARYLQGQCGASRHDMESCYWVDIPLVTPAHDYRQEPPQRLTDLSGKRALVVDDNDTCRNILVQQIQKLGLQVEQARDATEAMALLRTEDSIGNPFDIILLDHQMPGISGLQLARRIAEEPRFQALTMVMLTGLSQLPDKTLTSRIRISRLLTKPVSGKTIKTVLEQELAQSPETV